MANTSGQGYAAGFRGGSIFALDQETGFIAANSPSVPYTGVNLLGGKQFNLTIPRQRKIFHINADRVAAADFLPPTEAASATFAISANDNMPLEAILTNNTQEYVGEASSINVLTSQQGYEPLVALLLYQEELNAEKRTRTWRTFLVPRAKVIPMDAGMADKEQDNSYDVMFTPSSQNIFGRTLSMSVDNAVDAQYTRVMTKGLPALAAWVGDTYTVDFTLPTDQSPALSTAQLTVYVNGVEMTGGAISKTTTGFSLTVPPTASEVVIAFWEY